MILMNAVDRCEMSLLITMVTNGLYPVVQAPPVLYNSPLQGPQSWFHLSIDPH